MYAVNTYKEIEKREQQLGTNHVIALLFVRPSLPGANSILADFTYLHHNIGDACSVYAVGYSEHAPADDAFEKVKGVKQNDWYFSTQAFVSFKNKLEHRLKWKYSGDIELLLLQSNPEGKSILNFENYLSVDINYGIKKGYIESFPRFMEVLARSAKKATTVKQAALQVQSHRFKLREMISETLDDCKNVPTSVRRILKDALFFKTARGY